MAVTTVAFGLHAHTRNDIPENLMTSTILSTATSTEGIAAARDRRNLLLPIALLGKLERHRPIPRRLILKDSPPSSVNRSVARH